MWKNVEKIHVKMFFLNEKTWTFRVNLPFLNEKHVHIYIYIFIIIIIIYLYLVYQGVSTACGEHIDILRKALVKQWLSIMVSLNKLPHGGIHHAQDVLALWSIYFSTSRQALGRINKMYPTMRGI